jgi:hypothetical protein
MSVEAGQCKDVFEKFQMTPHGIAERTMKTTGYWLL